MRRAMPAATPERTTGETFRRLTAIIVAVVFAMGTLFVPAESFSAEAENDGALSSAAADADTDAAAEADTEAADADTDAADPAESQQDAAADADTDAAAAELEELVSVRDENGNAAALEDLDETEYDGFIYKLEDDVSKQEIKQMEDAIDELSGEPKRGEAAELISRNLYTADSLETIEEVASPEMIEYIEPDYIISTMATNDVYYGSGGWYLEMIKAPYVWERNTFGEGVTVAVIDTGVVMSHPDFENTSFVSPYNAIDGSDDVTDISGHGTGMAGIIAASYNNKKGLTGIMPKAAIMPIKVVDGISNGTHSALIGGIDYAASHGAHVVNMSLGDAHFSDAMNEACRQAADKGVILVAASGNNGSSTTYYPAAYDSVVSVGSIEADGAHSSFSTYNQYVDVVAPGRGIIMPSKTGYASLTGTSASSPQVAAMAAMVKSKEPSVNSDGFKEILQATCIDKGAAGRDDKFGYGLMDLSGAYRFVTGTYDTEAVEVQAAPQKQTVKISGTLMTTMTAKGSKSMKISWKEVKGVSGYDIFFGRCNGKDGGKDLKKVKTIKSGGKLQWTKTGLKKMKTYKVVVKAYVVNDGRKEYVRTSPTIHAYASGYTKGHTNARAVTVKKTEVTIKKGKTSRIKAKVRKLKTNRKLMPARHVSTLRYLSSDKKIAVVSKSGKITAKAKGTCKIYVYAHNGVYKAVRVTVK